MCKMPVAALVATGKMFLTTGEQRLKRRPAGAGRLAAEPSVPGSPQGSPLQPIADRLSRTLSRARKEHQEKGTIGLKGAGHSLRGDVKPGLKRKNMQRATPGREPVLQGGFFSPKKSPNLWKGWER